MILNDVLNIREKCTGCGVCREVCPMAAISMVSDQEGFWYPLINEEKCSACGMCAQVCPVSRKSDPINRDKNQVKIYAAWSENEKSRWNSTSGGIFSELALSVLRRGGYVCGAAYDGCNRVKHIIIEDTEALERLRQSKYVQSSMEEIYKEIGVRLCQRKPLLFCGTPCQCQAVSHYCEECGIDTSQLYLIDFICRGSNSPKVYEKFLTELEEEYQSTVSKVWFKNKTYGWNRFSTKIEFENGTYYLKDRYHDTFIRGYIEENLYIRPSCTDCKFKGFHRVADVTLGDFWGVRLTNQDVAGKSDNGVSVVMIHTEKGRKLWTDISNRVYCTEKTLEEVINGNVCFMHSVKPGKYREKFMRDLDSMPVIKNIERFLKNV